MTPLATVGVFGGSGFYSFLDDVEEVEVDTPYGPPSDRLFVGDVAGTRVAFLPRHGRNHHLPPHAIPYRANVWAMREIGVQRLIGLLANAVLGWWWADPAAALVIAALAVHEGRASWRGEGCCDAC